MQSVGIDVSKVELPFSPNIYYRALAPPVSNLGKTFDQGGFDLLFVGYNLGIDADPFSLYHSSQFAPLGENYYLWNNALNDQLTSQIQSATGTATRLNLVKQWQVLAANELPSVPILYTQEIVPFSGKILNGKAVFTAYHYPAWPPIEHLTTSQPDTFVILAETGQAPGQGVLPELSISYYDTAISNEVFSSLAVRNDTIFKTMLPELASGTPASPGWSVSPDGLTWTVNLRQGVTWQDGQPFTAKDVKFTFDLYQNDTFAAQTESFVKAIIGGKDNVRINGPYSVQFNLPAPYSLFIQNILSTAILPEHILNATSFYSQLGGKIDYSQIASSLFNRPDTGKGGVNPIGTGPYKWSDWNAAATTAHLVRNPNYFDFSDAGRSALLAKGQFTVRDYYVRTIVGSDQGITALNNGEVDILDSQYHLETQPSFLSTWGLSKIATYDGYGVQEIGVNMMHPVLGTGLDTPLGRHDPSKAALAARYVRQAISHAIPRDEIINQLLNGYGVPAITTPVVGDYRTGLAVTEGFNAALKPYDYNLTESKQLFQAAGYTLQPNSPPVLDHIDPKTVGQGSTLTFRVTGTDIDHDNLTFSLANSPISDAKITQSGIFTWTASGNLKPGNYNFTIVVTDDGYPRLSANQIFTVKVVDDTAPVWATGSIMSYSNIGETSVTLTWTPATDNVGVTNYKIFNGNTLVGSVSNDTYNHTASGITYSYRVQGLSPGHTYTFLVQAYDAAENAQPGPTVTLTTKQAANPSPVPVQPTLPWWQQYWYLILIPVIGGIITALVILRTARSPRVSQT